VATWSKA